MSDINIKLRSGRVFVETGENVTLADLNKAFDDGFAEITSPIRVEHGGTGASNVDDARSNLGIFNNWLNLKEDFNAVGDGVADDTQAIKDAVGVAQNSVRNVIYAPPGTYNFLGPISIPSDTIIIGAGIGATKFDNTGSGGENGFEIIGTGADVETGTPVVNVVLRDFELEGNGGSGDAINGNICSNISILRLLIDGHGGDGVAIGAGIAATNNKCLDIRVNACEIKSISKGVNILGGRHPIVSDNAISDYSSNGISIEDPINCHLLRNRLSAPGAGSADDIHVLNSTTNAGNVRPLKSPLLYGNIGKDPRDGTKFIHIETTGTTEICAPVIIGNAATKATGNYDFVVLAGIIKSARIDSNVIQSDTGASPAGVGITIGASCEDTVIGAANCFENGVNITDNGINTINFSTGTNLAKAWVSFDGTGTVAINDSFNVSSITDNGVGNYTVNYTNDFANTDYAFVADCDQGQTDIGALAVGTTIIKTEDSTGAASDAGVCNCIVFGAQ